MKIYNLTIMFDPDSDEVEFIEETIDDTSDDDEICLMLNDKDITEYFDKETLKLLVNANELGIT
jgi:hypothetical protein